MIAEWVARATGTDLQIWGMPVDEPIEVRSVARREQRRRKKEREQEGSEDE